MSQLLNSLFDVHTDDTILIIAAGNESKKQLDKIHEFIDLNNVVTIGINKMTHLYDPDYHLWTNNQRLNDQGDCITGNSKMLFGCGLQHAIIDKWWNGLYYEVKYFDKPNFQFKFMSNALYGYFRTAGNLAIAIADLMGARKIYIAGMDGFTLHKKCDIEGGTKTQHCYGIGHTDDYTWEDSIKKDREIYNVLKSIAEKVEFKIITETKYEKFYDSSILRK